MMSVQRPRWILSVLVRIITSDTHEVSSLVCEIVPKPRAYLTPSSHNRRPIGSVLRYHTVITSHLNSMSCPGHMPHRLCDSPFGNISTALFHYHGRHVLYFPSQH